MANVSSRPNTCCLRISSERTVSGAVSASGKVMRDLLYEKNDACHTAMGLRGSSGVVTLKCREKVLVFETMRCGFDGMESVGSTSSSGRDGAGWMLSLSSPVLVDELGTCGVRS